MVAPAAVARAMAGSGDARPPAGTRHLRQECDSEPELALNNGEREFEPDERLLNRPIPGLKWGGEDSVFFSS